MRRSTLILSLTLGGLLAVPSQSQAGPKELLAIAKQLDASATSATAIAIIQQADSTQLRDVVLSLIAGKTATAAAAYVGEALKRSNDSDFGTVLGSKLAEPATQATLPNIFAGSPDAAKALAIKDKFVGTSGKNAATGSGAFAEWVDDFAYQLVPNDIEAFAAAKAAVSSHTAVGAIVGSRVLDPAVDTDAERLQLAQEAILAKGATLTSNAAIVGQGFTTAAKEISQFVARSVTDAPLFATDLISTSATVGRKTNQQPLIAKETLIAPGVVAGAPLAADSVLEALFTKGGEATIDPVTHKLVGDPVVLATIKNAAKLASGIGLVADTEQYSFLATSFGTRIASGVIKKTLVNTIVKGLVTSMVKKPLPIGDPTGTGTFLGQDRNNAANRADEAGEIAAYMLSAIVGNSATNGLSYFKTDTAANRKAAVAAVKGLIKTVVSAYNNKKVKLAFNPTVVAADVAGSVAQTLMSLLAKNGTDTYIDAGIFSAIHDNLLLSSTAMSINKTKAADVMAAISSVFVSNNAGTKYEDGTVYAYQVGPFGGLTEPETDIRGG